MNPKITISIDAKNKAIATLTGMITVGSKVDIEISGLPDSIPNWREIDPYTGKSLRFRVVDCLGNDLVRYPLVKKGNETDGDTWDVDEGGVYANSDGCEVEFNTHKLRHAFNQVPFNEYMELGIILDSFVDSAEYAIGKIKVRQWSSASCDTPTVLPDWREILHGLKADLESVNQSKAAAAASAARSATSATNAATSELSASASESSAADYAAAANEAKEDAVEAMLKYPYIDEFGHWRVWSVVAGEWVDHGDAGAHYDDEVTETSEHGVKSSGIWNWVKSLLPDWLNKNYAEPATTASVSAEEQRAKAIELDLRRRVENLGSSKADKATIYTRSEMDSALEDKANASETYTKTETDEKINQFAAHYLTVDAIGSAFATKSALDEATVFYYAGQAFTPTKNDYCVVLEDESKDGKATRYAFVGEWGNGGSWQYQYTINNTAFTQEQWDAINSGATDEKIAEIDNKADISHTHAQSDVTGLSAALSGKLDQTGESDLRLNGGASIYFDGEEWLTRVDSMVSQYSWDWSSIYNTPTTLAGYGIEDAAKTSDIPSLSGQTFDLSVDAQFKNMCIATARALGAVVTHTTDDTSTGGQVAQAYGITPTDATTFGELQTKAGLNDNDTLGDL